MCKQNLVKTSTINIISIMPPNRKPAASAPVPSPSAFEVEARNDRAIGRRQRQQKKEQDAATEHIRNTATVSESVPERKTRSKTKEDEANQSVEAATNRTTPEGMNIPDDQGQSKSSPWTVGKMIGKGAEKEVFELGTDSVWACKMVKTVHVINATALRDEYQLLNSPLKSLQGSVVPSVPSAMDELSPMPYIENCEGYNIAVVARMNAELLTGIPAMVDEARARGDTAVDLSTLAARLVDMCEALHKEGYVNVDIKPENLMVDQQGQLCFIDFGLAQEIAPMGEKPFGAGTPAFMALSAHTTSPSPREDVESMIYLLAELLLRIKAAIRGEQLKPTDDTYLPWDLAAEEHAVLEEKVKHVKDFESTFYMSMPEDAAQCIKKSLELNWKCGYDDMPEYEELRQFLSSLKVPFEEQTPSAPIVAVTSKVVARILRPRQYQCNPPPVLRRW
jgi:hypothetical protein